MGDTLDAQQAGSLSYVLVAAIEGYPYLLTSGPPAAAVTAWAGTEWSAALGGLYLAGFNEQAADPWEPFRNGGRMSLQVVDTPSSGDAFGIATAKKTAGAETFLKATIDRNDTTITVASTAAFPSSGSAYIGHECFTYSGVTSTTFTGCTRGKYSPFLTNASANFAGHHRVGVDPYTVALEPLVTEQPRIWNGKWVGVWMHRVVNGVLDTKAEAQIIFAGRIVALYDDEATGATVVEMKHVLDAIKEQTLARDIFQARTREGMKLTAGMTFEASDFDGSTVRNADPLTVVASGATPPYEIDEGYFTLGQLDQALNDWLEQARADGDLAGRYSFTQKETQDGFRTIVQWKIPGAGPKVGWGVEMPQRVGVFLGFDGQPLVNFGTISIGDTGDDDEDEELLSPFEPKIAILHEFSGTGVSFELQDQQGVFWDNYPYLPEEMQTTVAPFDDWGLFLLDERIVIVARKDGDELTGAFVPKHPFTADQEQHAANAALAQLSIPMDGSKPPNLTIRQIFAIQAPFEELFPYLVLSTGTAGYNDPTYDVLPYGLGLAIPYDLAAAILTTVPGVPLAAAPLFAFIDEPTKFVDLMGADFLLRRTCLRFHNGSLEVATWKTPTASTTAIELGEDTKAAPSTQREGHRSGSSEQGTWKRPIIKIDYDRDILAKDQGGAGYRKTIVIEDKVSIDDAGGEATPQTIFARNSYAQYAQTGAAIEQLVQLFLSSATLFTRDGTLIRRSIDSRYFERLPPLTEVLVTDNFARDPDTGTRRVTARPALVIRNRHTWGGRRAGAKGPAPAGGEVDLFLLPTNRIAAYVPCAQVDETANAGGFSAGYNSSVPSIRLKNHAHSESSETADVEQVGDDTFEVRIIEIDPADPAAPLMWDRTVDRTSGTDLVLISTLTSPSWDPTKRYRVIWQNYADVTTAQQAKTYQADDTDGRVADLRAPYQYGYGGSSSPYTPNDPGDQVALPPDASFGDGAALDVGHQADLANLANNLLDRKMAVHSPFLHSSLLSGATATGTYVLVDMCPIHLSEEILGGGVTRSLFVSPHFASSDGASASVRVSLCRVPPTQNTLDDIDRGSVYAEATFTTTSTTYATPAAQELQIGPSKDIWGTAWLLVELSVKARSWGLAICYEGPRA